MSIAIKVYQIYYEPNQLKILEPAFIPYNNQASQFPDHREYRVFHENYHSGKTNTADYVGFMSWKFKAKTGLTGEKFIDFVRSNPGFDVYFVNPFWGEFAYDNVWLQGERRHPGLIQFTRKILNKAGYKLDFTSIKNNWRSMVFCNYWVGNQKFWDSYIKFCEPLYLYLSQKLSAEEKSFLAQRADSASDANYLPYIMERMFTTLLTTDPALKWLAYEFSDEELKARYPEHTTTMIRAIKEWDEGRHENAFGDALSAYRRLSDEQERFASSYEYRLAQHIGRIFKTSPFFVRRLLEVVLRATIYSRRKMKHFLRPKGT